MAACYIHRGFCFKYNGQYNFACSAYYAVIRKLTVGLNKTKKEEKHEDSLDYERLSK